MIRKRKALWAVLFYRRQVTPLENDRLQEAGIFMPGLEEIISSEKIIVLFFPLPAISDILILIIIG